MNPIRVNFDAQVPVPKGRGHRKAHRSARIEQYGTLPVTVSRDHGTWILIAATDKDQAKNKAAGEKRKKTRDRKKTDKEYALRAVLETLSSSSSVEGGNAGTRLNTSAFPNYSAPSPPGLPPLHIAPSASEQTPPQMNNRGPQPEGQATMPQYQQVRRSE